MQYISVDTITKISSELPAIVNHLSQKAHAVVREEKKILLSSKGLNVSVMLGPYLSSYCCFKVDVPLFLSQFIPNCGPHWKTGEAKQSCNLPSFSLHSATL